MTSVLYIGAAGGMLSYRSTELASMNYRPVYVLHMGISAVN